MENNIRFYRDFNNKITKSNIEFNPKLSPKIKPRTKYIFVPIEFTTIVAPFSSKSIRVFMRAENIVQRSASTSMSKRTNNTYSNDDLMKAILDMQKSQSVKFQELHGCLTSLKNEISELKNENVALHHELSAISARVAQLESKPAATSDSEVSSKLLLKISERNSSEYNVIVYGLSESNSPSINQRISDDCAELSSALSSIQIDLSIDFKLVRLGNNKTRKPRPIKIICNSKENAAQLISEFRQAVRSGGSIRDGLRIIRDKTSLERELLRLLISNLKIEINQASQIW